MNDSANGMVQNISFSTYLDLPGMNQTSLSLLVSRSPRHYKYALDTPQESTAAQNTGIFAHSFCLEPHTLLDRYVVEPTERFKREARTKGGDVPTNPAHTESFRRWRQEFREVNCDKQIVTQSEYEQVRGIAAAIWNDDLTKEKLQGATLRECVLCWNDVDTGYRCKARCDAIDTERNIIIDIKTTADIFRYTLHRWHHDLQAAFYADGYYAVTGRRATFWLILVETMPPFSIQAAAVGRVAMIVGHKKYKQALRTILDCEREQHWPGPPHPGEWSLPDYEVAKYLTTKVNYARNMA